VGEARPGYETAAADLLSAADRGLSGVLSHSPPPPPFFLASVPRDKLNQLAAPRVPFAIHLPFRPPWGIPAGASVAWPFATSPRHGDEFTSNKRRPSSDEPRVAAGDRGKIRRALDLKSDACARPT